MAYSLIHRTGLSRGRVYNASGENLTANPVGAGSDFIGPYAQDYSSIRFSQNVTYDHEFSGIIMDGRALRGAGNTDDSILYPDLDEDEDLSDRASVIGRDSSSARVSAVSLKLTHTRPRWADGAMWLVPSNGDPPEDLDMSFDEWLDLEEGPGTDPTETDLTWDRLRHYVKCPYYWAMYKVPLGPNYEGLSDMIAENSAVPVGQTGQLTYGPLGMLTALHGTLYATQHAYRLYEPTSSIVCVERGYGLMEYDSSFNDQLPLSGVIPAAGTLDPDIIITGSDQTISRVRNFQSSQGSKLGGIETLAVHSKRAVRAAPNEVYVWQFATAPVRVAVGGTAGGGTNWSIVVGNAVSPFYGPFVHIVYHECAVRYSAR